MTYEQTREQFLLAWNSNAYLNMCESDDMKNAIEALEKQIPTKPNTWNDFNGDEHSRCPRCNFDLGYTVLCKSVTKYCWKCGQKIQCGD